MFSNVIVMLSFLYLCFFVHFHRDSILIYFRKKGLAISIVFFGMSCFLYVAQYLKIFDKSYLNESSSGVIKGIDVSQLNGLRNSILDLVNIFPPIFGFLASVSFILFITSLAFYKKNK